MVYLKKMIISGLCAAGMLMVPGLADAAGNGYVNYPAMLQAMPAFSQAQQEMVSAQQTLQKQFNDQSKGMNDKQKKDLAAKLDKELQARQQAIQKNEIVPAVEKIRAAIEAAAKKNGVDFVVQESAWLYGGKDLTQDVIAQLK